MADKTKLAVDLGEKLNRLRWMNEQPELFIAEHFASIRNEIDLDAERRIDLIKSYHYSDSAARVHQTNTVRTKFIKFLDNVEAALSARLKQASTTNPACESFGELNKRVDEFSSSVEFKNLNEMEEAYLKLALDLIEATYEIEKRLLDNQTLVYMLDNSIKPMGSLIYLSEDFLNRDETSCLKQPNVDSFKLIHETVQASLNASLAVEHSRPFIITQHFLLILDINKQFYSVGKYNEKIACLKDASKDRTNLLSVDHHCYLEFKISTSEFFQILSKNSIEAVHIGKMPSGFLDFKNCSCDFKANRLRKFEFTEPLYRSFFTLELSENQLEAFDAKQLAKANRLRQLGLINAFLPDTRFSLDFLRSLKKLTELLLTWPDSPIDFSVFENLETLAILEIHSANSLDSSIERPNLTSDHFKQLCVMKKLSKVSLSHFKIDSLSTGNLNESLRFSDLQLSNNAIAEIQDGAFDYCFSNEWFDSTFVGLGRNSIRSISALMFHGLFRCGKLDLSHNRIEHFTPGVFAELLCLISITLNNNSIRHVTHGFFSNLPNLKTLDLNDNLIESIEVDSFDGCPKLEELFLANNKLKSISNQMLVSSNKNDESNETRPEEKSWFCGLSSLVELKLKGNQLEKVDLNCFAHLTKLLVLDLSNNRINEIKEPTNPVVLWNLAQLDLSNNKLTRISRNAFSESTAIQTLKLSGNKLETLDEDFFQPFRSLTELELQDNNLSIDITANTFNKCYCIMEINLLGNPSVRIQDGAFTEQKSLSYIHLELQKEDTQSIKRFMKLEDNRLFFWRLNKLSIVNSSIESFEAFKLDDRFSRLIELDLRRNRITSISHECFSTMPGLKLLGLAENMIENLEDPSLFKDLQNLENLDLSGNNLKKIHRQLFKDVKKLQKLDLSHNPVLNIDAGLFRGLFNLKKLNIAGNNITSFDLASLFRSCRVLESLDFSNNQLDHESINEASMSGITAENLKELILANNSLEKMDFVRNLYRLEKLDLSGNKIESVTFNGISTLRRLVSLRHVNLRANQIKSLDIKAIFSHLKYQLKFLDLSNNPFNSNQSVQSPTNCRALIEQS